MKVSQGGFFRLNRTQEILQRGGFLARMEFPGGKFDTRDALYVGWNFNGGAFREEGGVGNFIEGDSYLPAFF